MPHSVSRLDTVQMRYFCKGKREPPFIFHSNPITTKCLIKEVECLVCRLVVRSDTVGRAAQIQKNNGCFKDKTGWPSNRP
jgi:hypothetical protein